MLAGAALAIFCSALEVRAPVIDLRWFNLTTSKLAAVLFFALVIVWVLGQGAAGLRSFFSYRVLDAAVLAFVLSNLISVEAATDKAGAFKFALRMFYAAGMYLGISRLPRFFRSHLVVAWSVTVTVLMVVLVGLLQNYVIPVTWDWLLEPFEEGITTFGAFYNLRVASTLPFPTVLSMYLELCMPIALALGLWLISSETRPGRRRWLWAATIAGTVAIMMVQLFTYTRSGLVAAPASLLIGAALAALFGFGRRVWAMFALAALILGAILGGWVLFSNKMDVRLGLSQPENRYGAQYQLLDIPQDMQPDQEYVARIHVKNTGSLYWGASGDNEVNASCRWVSYPDGQEQTDVPFIISYLPHDIGPGQEGDIDVTFHTPVTPGRYVLDFDLIEVHVAWFSSAGVPGLKVPLDFTSGTGRQFQITGPATRFDAPAPDETATPRSQLWRAALRMWKDHPILGIGPDQFRNHYTDYLNVTPDNRIRTHDIFLETLANTGVIGLVVMVYLLGTAAWAQLRLVRDRKLGWDMRLLSLGLLVGLTAYVGHGLLDCFLWQTGVSFLFFGLLGLTSWLDYERRRRG